jgi:hypothetical protein
MRYHLMTAASAILAILSVTIGCGGGASGTPELPDTGIVMVDAWMPYVEDVTIPDPVYADEDFTLTLRVSSVLEPRLLNGNVQHKLYIVGPGFNPGRPTVALFPMWMREDLPPGPVLDTAELEYPAYMPLRLPAGEWNIAVQTAKTRELGGVSVSTDRMYLSDWDETYTDPNTGRSNFVEYRLYPITVVERPGA